MIKHLEFFFKGGKTMKDAQIGIIIDGTTLTDYAGDLPPSKDRVRYRRNRIVKLLLNGFSQRNISSTIHCSLSTIEKDIKSLRTQFLSQSKKNCEVVL